MSSLIKTVLSAGVVRCGEPAGVLCGAPVAGPVLRRTPVAATRSRASLF